MAALILVRDSWTPSFSLVVSKSCSSLTTLLHFDLEKGRLLLPVLKSLLQSVQDMGINTLDVKWVDQDLMKLLFSSYASRGLCEII